MTDHDNAAPVLALIRDHVTEAWLERSGVELVPELRFSELFFDAVDEFILAKRIELQLNVTVPDYLPWFDTVAELASFVARAIERQRRLKTVVSFFRDTWRPVTASYARSGLALVEEINALRPNNVLDLGCGDNPFKGRISNLIGLDVANPRADVRCDFLEFDPGERRFDVILALGSINFGQREDIQDELRHAKSMLADGGRIYMRVNPGQVWAMQPDLPIYPWNRRNIHENGADAGLAVLGEISDDVGANGLRLTFVYTHSPSAVVAARGDGHGIVQKARRKSLQDRL